MQHLRHPPKGLTPPCEFVLIGMKNERFFHISGGTFAFPLDNSAIACYHLVIV